MRGKVIAGTILITIGLAVVAAAFLPASVTRTLGEKDSEHPLAQFANYRQWTLVNPTPVMMDLRTAILCGRPTLPDDNPNPHSTRYISVYVNQLGRESMMTRLKPEFPQGSIIVKEKVNDPRAKNPELLTAMVKREKGYNPESGDWEYFVLDGSASTIKAQGKIEKCQTCHVNSKDTDYVDRSYLPKEIQEKLQ
ncbi:MAG TPA: cytochrome P460 family protein [Pyrinomonadaceae bacterium]|nr:cytochrome P460 family protein [Pyrinomonadaceae bacterium]